MDKFETQQTSRTPLFLLDPEKGFILYRGRFIPEGNPYNFMEPIHRTIKEYAKSPQKITVVEIYYEYINTGNLRHFLESFKLIKEIERKGKLICRWHIDDPNDEESIEMCNDVIDYSGLCFEMVDDSKTLATSTPSGFSLQ